MRWNQALAVVISLVGIFVPMTAIVYAFGVDHQIDNESMKDVLAVVGCVVFALVCTIAAGILAREENSGSGYRSLLSVIATTLDRR